MADGQDEQSTPKWASVGDYENSHIGTLFSIASQSFERHENWFLYYYSAGIKNLATILVAETALIGLHVGKPGTLPDVVLVTLLSVFIVVGFMLCRLAITSCERAYIAAMESLVVMHKSAWALGLTSKVAVKRESIDPSHCPVSSDLYLYGVRWLEGGLEVESEGAFVKARLGDRKNTYAMAKNTMWTLWGAVITVGVGAVAAVIWPELA